MPAQSMNHNNGRISPGGANTNISINFPMYMSPYHPYGYSQRPYTPGHNSSVSVPSSVPSSNIQGVGISQHNHHNHHPQQQQNSSINLHNLPPYAEYQ